MNSIEVDTTLSQPTHDKIVVKSSSTTTVLKKKLVQKPRKKFIIVKQLKNKKDIDSASLSFIKPQQQQSVEFNLEQAVEAYVSSFDDKERIAHNIAVDHLGSSFDITKSIGFQKFLQSYKK